MRAAHSQSAGPQQFLAAWFATRQVVHALHFNRFHMDGLSGTQFMALTYLARGEGAIKMTALAERLTITPSTAARLVDTLVRRGLVVREPDANDRRVTRITLSKTGKQRQQESQRSFEASIAAVFQRLSDAERKGLVRGLEAFARAADLAELQALERSHGR